MNQARLFEAGARAGLTMDPSFLLRSFCCVSIVSAAVEEINRGDEVRESVKYQREKQKEERGRIEQEVKRYVVGRLQVQQ